jgi:hypothetical protein
MRINGVIQPVLETHTVARRKYKGFGVREKTVLDKDLESRGDESLVWARFASTYLSQRVTRPAFERRWHYL